MDRVRFQQVLESIRRGAADRERARNLPIDLVRDLVGTGFGAFCVPADLGGGGGSVTELVALLEEVAAADPNVAQALRPHFGFTLRQLLTAPDRRLDPVLRAVCAGSIVSTAAHEQGPSVVGRLGTTLTEQDDRFTLDGVKHYSTGTLYADHVSVLAETADGGRAFATVPTDAPGVVREDDWDGFGQRLTASGTTRFEAVAVPAGLVEHLGAGGAPGPLAPWYQLVLLATLAGIARAVLADTVEYVQTRTRVFSHGQGNRAAEDPLVLAAVGRVRAAQFAAGAAVAAATVPVQHAFDAADPSAAVNGTRLADLVDVAEEAVSAAQIAVVPLVLDAATTMFEVGGASATSAGRGFDRHWRNARTVASHNPVDYRARSVGDHLVNGRGLVHAFATGEGKKA